MGKHTIISVPKKFPGDANTGATGTTLSEKFRIIDVISAAASKNESALNIKAKSFGASGSASVLPMNIWD